jgi:hypothetical protein
MKFSSLQIGVVSVVAAVILWMIATWFEDDARWLPAETSGQVDTQLQSPRPDTPVRTATDVLSCEQSEALLNEDVAAAGYCSSDDDCTLFDYGYPIQCMTSVSKEQIAALRLAYRRYENSCSYRVYYDCPTGEMVRMPICRNNHCEVELTTSDPLQDATLQYLGIKDP